MRKINTEDVFKMARLMKEADLTKDIKEAYMAGKKEGANTEEVGMNVFMNIICSVSDKNVESKFYDLLSGITEKTEEQVKTQSLEATLSDLKQIAEENNFGNFLKSASKLSGSIKN